MIGIPSVGSSHTSGNIGAALGTNSSTEGQSSTTTKSQNANNTGFGFPPPFAKVMS
jgi:hypothetical protein